jgi:glutamine amidotransferase
MNVKIGILDISLGNHQSVLNACKRLGAEALVSMNPEQLDKSNALILPGVGSFPKGMKRLTETGLDHYLKKAHSDHRKILGICLGMQLLAESSCEYEDKAGLGLFQGHVEALSVDTKAHIGWSPVEPDKKRIVKDNIGCGMAYFNHSYALRTSEHACAYTKFGIDFVSIARNGNTLGFQFHPEKSQQFGLQLLKEFIYS